MCLPSQEKTQKLSLLLPCYCRCMSEIDSLLATRRLFLKTGTTLLSIKALEQRQTTFLLMEQIVPCMKKWTLIQSTSIGSPTSFALPASDTT